MRQRPSFKNLPKIQAKRFKKLMLEKDQKRAERMKVRSVRTRSSRTKR